MSDNEITSLVEQIAQCLVKSQQKLAVAESCTGGWIAKVLTDLAGSSSWFERGFVTYSNAAKQEMLGVNAATIETYGAVSEETVSEMAAGALKMSCADFSLSVSGIAGPQGGTAEKPVGLVWFAWGTEQVTLVSEQKIFSGGREAVREQSVIFALTGLVKLL